MMKIKVGFLPLYLELYDDTCKFMRYRIEQFCDSIKNKLEDLGLEIVAAPICRVESEFSEAISLFDDVCAVITLHLAYSPSLESIDALAKIQQPIIVLDTTPTYDFGPSTSDEEILYNHGIHGVQDMCNMLKRRGKLYFIEAGHWIESDVLDRVYSLCQMAAAAYCMKTGKVGIIGNSFEGMGDFFVTPAQLRESVGAQVVHFDMGQVRQRLLDITEDEINSEMREDLTIFIPDKYDEQTHHRTAKADIMVRKWIEENDLMAFTFNFANIEKRFGFECVPFIEACKAMGRGIGYAGEGDVLTAVLCGAMLRAFPETSFAEMFCPDWKGNGIFLSHMGEMNINTVKGKMKLTEKEYGFSDADNPMAVYGCFKPGDAVLMNLAPTGDSNYSLILSRVTVLDVESENRMKDSIHGWIQPHMPIDEFLKQYSMAGGTHHLVMIYGDILDKVKSFGEMMRFHVEVI